MCKPRLRLRSQGECFRHVERVGTTGPSRRMVSILNPSASWVARRLKLKSRMDDDERQVPFKVGVYAIALDLVEEAERGPAQYDQEEDEPNEADDAFIATDEEVAAEHAAAGSRAPVRRPVDDDDDEEM
jgi:hypothetical protein